MSRNAAGISRSTFYNICQRDEAVATCYRRGKARAIAHVANGLLQRARSGCTASAIFYLKTQAGWRETERHETTGAHLTISGQVVSPGEILRQRLDAIAARITPAGAADEGD